jgi:hypothetical protein
MRRFLLAAALAAYSVALPFAASAVQMTQLVLVDEGGADHGCLNCNPYASSSVCNEFGRYGSEFNGDSIWNEFGKVGSKFKSESPWNSFGSGLKLVGSDGKYYGQFTSNKFARNRANSEALDQWFEAYRKLNDLQALRKLVCSN